MFAPSGGVEWILECAPLEHLEILLNYAGLWEALHERASGGAERCEGETQAALGLLSWLVG